MTLFDTFVRTDSAHGQYSESPFAFLNRSARPDAATVRDLLESWSGRVPADHRDDLARRFRSRDRHGFESAFFELFLHEMLLCLGLSPTVHPALAGTARHPDFLAQGPEEFFLEAAVVRDESAEETSARARENAIYDALNQLDSPNFFLRVEINVISSQTPSGRSMRQFLQNHLAGLDPDGPLPGGWRYQGEGWSIFFQPVAKSPDSRNRAGVRPVGILSPRAKYVTTREAIKREIAGKASRYGLPGKPYVIALNVLSEWGCDDRDVIEALFGTVSNVFRSTPTGIEPVGSVRNPNGAWQGPTGPIHTRVSAVLLIRGLWPWTVAASPMCFYHNPHTQLPIRRSFSRLPHAIVDENGSMQLIDGIDGATLFGLPARWPGSRHAAVQQR